MLNLLLNLLVLPLQAEVGSSGAAGGRKFSGGQAGSEQFIMKVPNNKVSDFIDCRDSVGFPFSSHSYGFHLFIM